MAIFFQGRIQDFMKWGGGLNCENQYKIKACHDVFNEFEKLPYSIQYLAHYDSFVYIYFFIEKEGVRPLLPHLDPPLFSTY